MRYLSSGKSRTGSWDLALALADLLWPGLGKIHVQSSSWELSG